MTFVPSHCGILDNEHVDKSAKEGALNSKDCEVINIPLSLYERCHLLKNKKKKKKKKNPVENDSNTQIRISYFQVTNQQDLSV